MLQNNIPVPFINSNSEINENISSDDETPPSPPPRSTSCQQPPARPLPNIPKSTSLNDVHYEDGDSSMEEVGLTVTVFNVICELYVGILDL